MNRMQHGTPILLNREYLPHLHVPVLDLNGTDEFLTRTLPNNLLTGSTPSDWSSPGSAPANWTSSGATWNQTGITGQTGTYCIKLTGTNANIVYSNLVEGKKYKLRIRWYGDNALRVGSSVNQSDYFSFSATSQWNTKVVTFTATSMSCSFSIGSGTAYVDIANITPDWKLDLNESWELIKHSKNRDFEQTLVTTYASNFSAGVDGWVGSMVNSLTGNIDNVSDGAISYSDCLSFTTNGVNNNHYITKAGILNRSKVHIVSFNFYIPTSNTNVDGIQISDYAYSLVTISSDCRVISSGEKVNASASPSYDPVFTKKGVWCRLTYTFRPRSGNSFHLIAVKSNSSSFVGANSPTDDIIYIKNFTLTSIPNLLSESVSTFSVDSNSDGLADGWIKDASVTATRPGTANTMISPYQRVSRTGGGNCYIGFTYPLIVGKRYFISGGYRSSHTLNIYKANGTAYFTLSAYTGVNDASLVGSFTATESTLYLGTTHATEDMWCEFQNICIYEIPEYTSSGNHTNSYTTVDKYSGTGSLYISASGAGDSTTNYFSLPAAEIDNVTEGKKYTLEAYVRSDTASRTVTFRFGNVTVTSNNISTTPGAFTKVVCNFVATSAEVGAVLKGYFSAAGGYYLDNVSITQAYDFVRLLTLNSNLSDKRSVYSFGVNNYLELDAAGKLNLSFGGDTQIITDNTVTYAVNQWFTFILVFNRTDKVIIYKNGTGNTGVSITGIGKVIYSAKNNIGANSADGERFSGLIGQIQYLRFDNIGSSDFAPGTYKPGHSVSGGGPAIVASYNWNGVTDAEMLSDKSGTGNNLTGNNVTLLDDRKKVILR